MSKRAPELETLVDSRSGGRVYHTEKTDAAIRSQRVKLHRERAKLRMVQASLAEFCGQLDPLHDWSLIVRRHEKAAARFRSRADKIERGEL